MDLAEEVLSKLPMTSLSVVRLICKKLNILSKSRWFTRKLIAQVAKKKEFQVVMLLENRVSLMSVNLISPSIDPIGKLYQVEISEIYHCEGLLLCITKTNKLNSSRLLVWNPFLGQTRWIQPRDSYYIWDKYVFGYDKSLRTPKILRFVYSEEPRSMRQISDPEFEIYNLKSNSWKVLDVNPDWHIKSYQRGLWATLTERFGSHLSFPFHAFGNVVALSSVGEKQLAVLFQNYYSPAPALILNIWISDNVESNAVSWKELFLPIDMKQIFGCRFIHRGGSFFVDEEKNLAVLLDKERGWFNRTGDNMAYIIGKNGCLKQVNLGKSTNKYCHPRVSYHWRH